jgi:hypothetical protein
MNTPKSTGFGADIKKTPAFFCRSSHELEALSVEVHDLYVRVFA